MKNDFADWINPMVVKELRQGLRARSFVFVFALVQFLLVAIVISMLLNRDTDPGAFQGFFWGFLGVALLGMPLRGLNTLSGEMKENTLELLLLTRLSAWRIAFGKWCSLAAQSLLLLLSVLPYFLMRYFTGNVDLVGESLLLLWLILGNLLLSALAVGLSPHLNGVLGKIGIVMAVIFGMQTIPWFFFALSRSGTSLPGVGWQLGSLVALAPLLVLLFMELPMAKIAPAAENHATRARVLTLAITLLCFLFGMASGERTGFMVLALFLALPIAASSALEPTPAIPVLYRPILPRHPGVSRLLDFFLLPGSGPGLLFLALLTGIFLATFPINFHAEEQVFRVVISLTAIAMPLAVQHLIPFFSKLGFVGFILFHLGQLLLSGMIGIMVTGKDHVSPLVGLLPTTSLIFSFTDKLPDTATLPLLAVLIVSLSVLLRQALVSWRRIREMRQAAS